MSNAGHWVCRVIQTYEVCQAPASIHSGWDKWFHATLRVASGATPRSIP